MITDRANPRRVPGIETHPSGDELLVHDTRHGKVHVLNATAAAIFSLCDGDHDLHAIVEEVAAAWSADEAVVATDVPRIVATFRELALLESLADRGEATSAAVS
jgi:pyrroloquinoline quinone biosynthesis protein D